MVARMDTHTMKQMVIHGHLEMQCADQFPPIVILLSALIFPSIPPPPFSPSFFLSFSLSLSLYEQKKHTYNYDIAQSRPRTLRAAT